MGGCSWPVYVFCVDLLVLVGFAEGGFLLYGCLVFIAFV